MAKPDRSEENTGKYAQACRDLVKEVEGKARLVDVWQVSVVPASADIHGSDRQVADLRAGGFIGDGGVPEGREEQPG